MIIESKELKAEFSTKGAELISLQDQKGQQYIWQGAEGSWQGKAPLLFPICGFLKENFYYYKNHQYFMQVHGLANHSDFKISQKSLQSISFILESSPKSKMHYPFDFTFTVKYTLKGNSLEVLFSIINNNNSRMLCSYGWHPGFSLNWQSDDHIDNYYLAFPDNKNLKRIPVNKNGLLQNERQTLIINKNNTLSIDSSSFKERAIVLENYPYNDISLRHIHSQKSIDMHFKNFQNLTLWGQESADFICLEPWNGLGDFENHNQQFIEKKGLINIPAGKSSEALIKLTINSA